MKKRVVVAMSGGVDSSVTAALLLERGYDVYGIMLKLWKYESKTKSGNSIIADPIASASEVAKKLCIPFEVVNLEDLFRNTIVQQFINQYDHGFTPNPCFLCNQKIKWGFLLDRAKEMGATALATGHYAKINQEKNNLFHLLKGADPFKDQSYILAGLVQEQLKYALLPLGEMKKSEVKQIARHYGLNIADSSDSQDLCFLPEGNYREFLSGFKSINERPGPMRLITGEIIGEHQGLMYYTIGQRKGLGSGLGVPHYVVGLDIEKNELVVGTKEDLGSKSVLAGSINWISGDTPDISINYEVKIRYKAIPVVCRIEIINTEIIKIILNQPVRDATPGQIAVIYNKDEVIGSGVILSTERE